MNGKTPRPESTNSRTGYGSTVHTTNYRLRTTTPFTFSPDRRLILLHASSTRIVYRSACKALSLASVHSIVYTLNSLLSESLRSLLQASVARSDYHPPPC